MQASKWVVAAAAAALLLGGAPAARALPLVSELFYDAIGSDDGNAFVELYGAPGASVAGLRLQIVNGDNGAITGTLILAGAFGADGLFVVADRTSAGTTAISGADQLLDFDLQNGPDSLVLRDANGVLDAVGYGVFGAGLAFLGEGSPAVDVPAGSSLARRFANVDTDDNALDFAALAVPTPGSAPIANVPEPGTATLAACGLAGLARRARPPRG